MKKVIITALAFLAFSEAKAQFKPRASIDYFLNAYNVKVSEQINIPGYGPFENSIIATYGSFRVRVGGEYRFKRFSAYFDQNVYMNKAQNISFQPLQAEWYTGVKFHIAKELSLKAEHMCMHPILSDVSVKATPRVYGGYNMISLSYGY